MRALCALGRREDPPPVLKALYVMRVSTRGDWGVIDKDDIEAQYALDFFLGKTQEEAWGMCDYYALNYQEELQSLPEYPFNFYASVLAKYIISDDAIDDSDGASSFISMVAWMLKRQRNIIYRETEKLLIASAEKVANNQEFYDAPFDIYGDFKEEFKKVLTYANI